MNTLIWMFGRLTEDLWFRFKYEWRLGPITLIWEWDMGEEKVYWRIA